MSSLTTSFLMDNTKLVEVPSDVSTISDRIHLLTHLSLVMEISSNSILTEASVVHFSEE